MPIHKYFGRVEDAEDMVESHKTRQCGSGMGSELNEQFSRLRRAGSITEIKDEDVIARINNKNSQLCSVMVSGTEFMWGGGRPDSMKTEDEKMGWQNSEITMFPIVGRAVGDRITIDGVEYPMTQHGIYRYLPSKHNRAHGAAVNEFDVTQEYAAGTEVASNKGKAVFPFGYTLTKQFAVMSLGREKRLDVSFDPWNSSMQSAMPYAIGWHPAFRAVGETVITVGSKEYTLEEIKAASKEGAVVIEGATDATYRSEIGSASISTTDFGNMQLWSPEGQKLVCIEPISAMSLSRYSYTGELASAPGYRVLQPLKNNLHFVTITFNPD